MSEQDTLIAEIRAAASEARALTAEVRAERATVDAYRSEVMAWRTETAARFDTVDRELQSLYLLFAEHTHPAEDS